MKKTDTLDRSRYSDKAVFAIHFAAMDLRNLGGKDQSSFQEKLCDFLEIPATRGEKWTMEELTPVQDAVRRLLRAVIVKGEESSESHMVGHFPNVDIFFDLQKGDLRPFLHSTKPNLTEAVLFELCVALSKGEAWRVRECPLCHRTFFADHGRQLFCSYTCSNRTRLQRFLRSRGKSASEHQNIGEPSTVKRRKRVASSKRGAEEPAIDQVIVSRNPRKKENR